MTRFIHNPSPPQFPPSPQCFNSTSNTTYTCYVPSNSHSEDHLALYILTGTLSFFGLIWICILCCCKR
jgi:hypothetical protein